MSTPRIAPVITVRPLFDPVVDRLGFPVRSIYVEGVVVAVLGPSTTLALRRLGTLASARPGGVEVDVAELGASLGLGTGIGKNSTIVRTLARLVSFDMARWGGRGPHGAPDGGPTPASPGPPAASGRGNAASTAGGRAPSQRRRRGLIWTRRQEPVSEGRPAQGMPRLEDPVDEAVAGYEVICTDERGIEHVCTKGLIPWASHTRADADAFKRSMQAQARRFGRTATYRSQPVDPGVRKGWTCASSSARPSRLAITLNCGLWCASGSGASTTPAWRSTCAPGRPASPTSCATSRRWRT